jgi:hypothetical protein
MPAFVSISRTVTRHVLSIGAVLTLVACRSVSIMADQGAWTIPHTSSVVVESDDTSLENATEFVHQFSSEASPPDNGNFIGADSGEVSNPITRYEGSPAATEDQDWSNGASMATDSTDYDASGDMGAYSPKSVGCTNESCTPSNPWCGLHKKEGVCWAGRADALILFRDAPPNRPITVPGVGLPLLNADGMDSPAAAGPRFSLFRFNQCNGTGIEATYLRAANWRSQRPLSASDTPYTLASPGIYGNSASQNFNTGTANLGAALQSFELNRHWCKGEHLRLLAGFRWVEWQESFSLSDSYSGKPVVNNFYDTDCINSLYGGQIGLDAWLLTLPWMRIDSVIKAGAYYNNAVQSSLFQSNATGDFSSQSVTVNESPLNCAFVGELGMTGVVPISNWLDLRVGYFGMWLSGIAQPTQQLSGQVLTLPAGGTDSTAGSINANGSTLVQGVSIGLEGRW